MWHNLYYLSHKTLPLDHIPRQSKPHILPLCVHYIPKHSLIIRPPISDSSFQIISHLYEFRRMCFIRLSSPTLLCSFSSRFAHLAQWLNTSSTERVLSEIRERLKISTRNICCYKHKIYCIRGTKPIHETISMHVCTKNIFFKQLTSVTILLKKKACMESCLSLTHKTPVLINTLKQFKVLLKGYFRCSF